MAAAKTAMDTLQRPKSAAGRGRRGSANQHNINKSDRQGGGEELAKLRK